MHGKRNWCFRVSGGTAQRQKGSSLGSHIHFYTGAAFYDKAHRQKGIYELICVVLLQVRTSTDINIYWK